MQTGLEVRGLSKRFGGLTVSESIDFDLTSGDRKALMGELYQRVHALAPDSVSNLS